jgi:hypothetical protein
MRDELITKLEQREFKRLRVVVPGLSLKLDKLVEAIL